MIAKKLFVIGYLLIEILIIVHQNSLDGHFANWKTTFNTIHETKFNFKKKTFKLHFFSMENANRSPFCFISDLGIQQQSKKFRPKIG